MGKSPRNELSRREFLRDSALHAGALVAAAYLPSCASLARRERDELLFFASDPMLTKNGMSSLCVFDPAAKTLSSIPVPLELAHGCFANPGRAEQVFAVEQSGPRACAVNLVSREVRTFNLDAQKFDFYGHGLFLPGGDFFVTTEVNRETKEGRIAVRRSDTFAIAEVFPSHGLHPHDLRLIRSGTVLVTANHGHGFDEAKDQGSSVSFVELASRKLLHQVHIEELGCFASHLEAVGDDDVLVACRRVARKTDAEADRIRKEMNDPVKRTDAMRNAWRTIQYVAAPLYWIKAGTVAGKAAAEELGGHMKNSLSLAFAPAAGVLGITHLEGEIVSFWDVRTRKLLRVHELPGSGPHGLVYLEKGDVFVAGLVKGLASFDGGTLAMSATVVPAPFGVHMGKTPRVV